MNQKLKNFLYLQCLVAPATTMALGLTGVITPHTATGLSLGVQTVTTLILSLMSGWRALHRTLISFALYGFGSVLGTFAAYVQLQA